MKQVNKFFSILTLALIMASCTKEDSVSYRFEVQNLTDTSITVKLSSWGSYNIAINGMFDSKYKFQEVETIKPNGSLTFSKNVGGNSEPYEIPSSLTPAWEYITAIECDGVTIPKEYFTKRENWELNVEHQINGTFTYIKLYILPELIEQIRNNSR